MLKENPTDCKLRKQLDEASNWHIFLIVYIYVYDHSYGVMSEIIYIPGIIFLFFHVNKWYIFSAYSTYSFTVHFSLDLNNYKWTSSNTQRRNLMFLFFFANYLSLCCSHAHTHAYTYHAHGFLSLSLIFTIPFSFFPLFLSIFPLFTRLLLNYRFLFFLVSRFLVYVL